MKFQTMQLNISLLNLQNIHHYSGNAAIQKYVRVLLNLHNQKV